MISICYTKQESPMDESSPSNDPSSQENKPSAKCKNPLC